MFPFNRRRERSLIIDRISSKVFTFHRRTTEEDSEAGGLVEEDQLLELDPESSNWLEQACSEKNCSKLKCCWCSTNHVSKIVDPLKIKTLLVFQQIVDQVDTWKSPTGSLLMLMSPNCITCKILFISIKRQVREDWQGDLYHAGVRLLLDNLVLLLQGLLLDVLLVAVLQPLHFQMMASPHYFRDIQPSTLIE